MSYRKLSHSNTMSFQ